MNRLVIIGNGFDLAHGLPTSYRDFIDDYWVGIKSKFDLYLNNSNYEDEFVKIDYKFDLKITVFYDVIPEVEKIESYNDFRNFITKYSKKSSQGIYKNECVIDFKNNLFENICEANSIQNWVDVENEYYRQLKKIIKSKCLDVSKSDEFWQNQQKTEVQKLNREFEEIKSLLENYLKEKVISKYNFGLFHDPKGEYFKIQSLLKPISYKDEDVIHELPSQDYEEIMKIFDEQKKSNVINTSLYFLDFNYTPTVQKYLNGLKNNNEVNYIHGFIGDDDDYKINFGFGDEMDDDYKDIENLGENEYLKNFKSFKYLQNSNYRHLLDFIAGEKFQVYIMGHSCGLSDRTLLNTIFEHENCRSIKIFYHKKERYDNFTEIIQNISRHFNDKKLMRSKIVDKTLCKPLPQIQLPKK